MRIKEANGLSVWLAVDGEKLDEQTVRKTGDEDEGFRIECFLSPLAHQDYTIHVQLGRQSPWKGDWVAEPIINGQRIHSLHIRKRWHVTHGLDTYYQEERDGSLMEYPLCFGAIDDPTQMEIREGDDSGDGGSNMVIVEISRGEIQRVKPSKRKIGQRVRPQESTTQIGPTTRSGRKCDGKTGYGEEFDYDEEDRQGPFLKFVFKIRNERYLVRNNLQDRVPAQQHPSQVSRTVRLKAEPDLDIDDLPLSSSSTSRHKTNTQHSSKRELPEDSVIPESESAKRLRMAENEIKQLKKLVTRLTSSHGGRNDSFQRGQSSHDPRRFWG
ncbi:uncharacterized protein IL334_002623 [Kwoniella shivajii]|uniref:Uncharacterized protein n=1 Tax=Kwoniella shivajii TaxID=564305 RepID=A0ABZ1CV89_9TREE|nr:hypothetical protein IL334_002623 [Kwoniella shivajii]